MAIATSIETGRKFDALMQKDSQFRRPFTTAGVDRGLPTIKVTGRPSFGARVNPGVNRTRSEIRAMFR